MEIKSYISYHPQCNSNQEISWSMLFQISHDSQTVSSLYQAMAFWTPSTPHQALVSLYHYHQAVQALLQRRAVSERGYRCQTSYQYGDLRHKDIQTTWVLRFLQQSLWRLLCSMQWCHTAEYKFISVVKENTVFILQGLDSSTLKTGVKKVPPKCCKICTTLHRINLRTQ